MIRVDIEGGESIEFEDGTPDNIIDKVVGQYISSASQVDRESGAKYGERSILGNMPIEDQLASMQQVYPDAEIEPKSEVLGNKFDNIIYTDPETGTRKTVNPEGFDLGDIAQHRRTGMEMAGQGMGAVLGGLAGTADVIPGDEIPAIVMGQALGGEAMGLLDDTLMEAAGRKDPRGPTKRLLDASKNVAFTAIANKSIDNILKSGGRLVSKALTPKTATPEAKEALSHFRDLGIRPTAGSVSGSTNVQKGEEFIQKTLSGGRVRKAINETYEGAADKFKGLVDEIGTVRTPQELGLKVLKPSAQRAVKRFEMTRDVLESKAQSLIGADTAVTPANTLSTIDDIIKQFDNAEELGSEINKKFIGWGNKIFNSPNIDYKAIRAFRTEVGGLLDTADSATKGKLERLYGALTSDLERVAEAKGGAALEAFQNAVRYQRRMHQSGELSTLRQMAKHERPDETVYKYAMSGAKDGDTRLKVLKKHTTPADWDDMAATTLYRMGMATKGNQRVGQDIMEAGAEFSPGTLISNWTGGISPEAKKILFDSANMRPLRENMDKLVKTIDRLKITEKVKNTSKTSDYVQLSGLLLSAAGATAYGGIGGGATAMAVAVIPPAIASRVITHPRFINWLAHGIQIAETKPYNLAKHVSRLGAIFAREDKDVQDAVSNYQDFILKYVPTDKQEKLEAK